MKLERKTFRVYLIQETLSRIARAAPYKPRPEIPKNKVDPTQG